MSDNNGASMDAESQEMLRSFVSESFDSLDTNEPLVEDLRLEGTSESINSIFRVFHTLKGLSGFFEMMIINKVTHEAETLLDFIRKQNKPQTEETITVIYQTFDFLRDLLQRVNSDMTDKSATEEAEDMILIIKDSIEKVKNPTEIVEDFSAFQVPQQTEIQDTQIDISFEEEELPPPPQDNVSPELLGGDMLDQFITSTNDLLDSAEKNLLELEKNPNADNLLNDTFRMVHSIKGNAGFMGLGEIEEIGVEMETILDCLRKKELDVEQNIITILLSNTEAVRNRVAIIEKNSDRAHAEQDSGGIQQSTKIETIKTDEVVQSAPISVQPEIVSEAPVVRKPVAPAQESSDEMKASKLPAMQRKDIRVETIKIDKLFDLVGELITIETMVTSSQDLAGLDLPNFTKSANMLNKITRELQEISMSIRMMPLEGLFNKMKRLVRDVSIKMKKKVELNISGQDTEMDKNVIDEISDPLVHILRNSIDHGVELPEDRLAKGKSETGTVTLSARYEGNEILIIVEDDGAGIDRQRILDKAEEKGLLKVAPDTLSDRDVFGILFEPGFSTAKVITDISGRGVGMDVVKKNIEKLRGRVTVDSVLGKGSKFTLRIPLTLAILEAMVIRIGESKYAVPLLSVRESFRPNINSINITMDGLEVARVRDEVIPIIRLHELLQVEPDSKTLDKGILIIIESREKRVCLFADEIIGQQQAVIKNLSDFIGKVPGLTGCMVLGDGGIGLILDIESLIEMSEQNELHLA